MAKRQLLKVSIVNHLFFCTPGYEIDIPYMSSIIKKINRGKSWTFQTKFPFLLQTICGNNHMKGLKRVR